MKRPATRSAKRSASKPPPAAALTHLIVLHAVRTWVVPTLTITVATVVYLASNLGAIAPQPAITIIGSMLLLLALFWGLRDFLDPDTAPVLRVVLAVFTMLWCAAIYVPFYLTLNPGQPLFSAELHRGAAPVTVALNRQPGPYRMIVESHFTSTERMHSQAATYRIAVAHDGVTERLAEGTFHQDWHNQRVGAGRRSFLVPAMSETTEVLNVFDDPDGHDVSIQLTELSPEVGDSVKVRLYREHIPEWGLVAMALAITLAAMALDGYRPKTASPGVLTTVTFGAALGVATMRASSAATPGFPQLVVGAVLGVIGGAAGGALLSRLGRPLLRYLPDLG
jgi:hypothetical protein